MSGFWGNSTESAAGRQFLADRSDQQKRPKNGREWSISDSSLMVDVLRRLTCCEG